MSYMTRYRILRSSNLCILKNDLIRKETCKSHSKIILDQICEMEKILENKGSKGRSFTWIHLGFEVQVEASKAII